MTGFSLMSLGALVQASFVSAALSVLALALVGFGVSFAIPALLTAVAGAAPPELAGVAGGAVNVARQTGAVLGVAILGALLNATTATTALLTAAASLLVGAVIAAAATTRPPG